VQTAFERTWADPEHPVGAHLGLMVIFNLGLGALLVAAARRGVLPARPSVRDMALLGVAAHKLSRLVATERVTAPLRAPFVEDPHHEQPAGEGPRRAMGELLTCPYCLVPWCTLALGTGLAFAPRPTRYLCGLFSAMTVADVLHRGYALLRLRHQRAMVRTEAERRAVDEPK
jgi:hypothetical protein